jgi:hypothetical protein
MSLENNDRHRFTLAASVTVSMLIFNPFSTLRKLLCASRQILLGVLQTCKGIWTFEEKLKIRINFSSNIFGCAARLSSGVPKYIGRKVEDRVPSSAISSERVKGIDTSFFLK